MVPNEVHLHTARKFPRPLDIREFLCTMASFPLIRLRKVRDNIVHESLLILIRRLQISNIARAEYRMLISEIYPIDNTLGNLARKRVIIEEHIESFSDC